MAHKPDERGLRSPGSTTAAVAVGLKFEDVVGEFGAYLKSNYGKRYTIFKSTKQLPPDDRLRVEQFFALCSTELKQKRPQSPQIGDIYTEGSNSPVMVFTDHSKWKKAAEGFKADHILRDCETGRLIFIEAKYGDTKGNAHYERAGSRATWHFLKNIERIFEGRARYLYIFGGPMVTARSGGSGPKIAERGEYEGKIVQTEVKRRFESARYHRKIEVLYGREGDNSLLWDAEGFSRLASCFENTLKPWLARTTQS